MSTESVPECPGCDSAPANRRPIGHARGWWFCECCSAQIEVDAAGAVIHWITGNGQPGAAPNADRS